MFDPTVFENLKVVVEGAVYDRDLDGEIVVTNREDLVDLASMSRVYRISFELKETSATAVFTLTADTKHLAAEILEEAFVPGCFLQVRFVCMLPSPAYCEQIQQLLESIWGQERMIIQQISYEYRKETLLYKDETIVSFQKVITEDHADDLLDVIEYMIVTLHTLQNVLEK